MTFLNGAADKGEPGHSGHDSGHDEVVIKIRGRTAARMLGRGDAEKRIVTELAGLKQRLDGMEATAAQRATQYEALSQAVEGLQEKVAQLSGQVADHRTELARLRNDYDTHAVRAAQAPGQVERVQMQVYDLQRQVGPVSGQITELQTELLNLERRLSPSAHAASGGDAGTQPDGASGTKPTSIWDRAAARTSWLKQRLNFW